MGKHYIPQKYLRGFTDTSNPDVLWQFDKKTLSFTKEPVPIAAIAQQRSFYNDDDETDLNKKIEGPGNRVLEKLRSDDFSLSDGDRKDLSAYMATMITRVPHHRAKGEAIAPGVLKDIISKLRDQVRAFETNGNISTDIANKQLAEINVTEERYAIRLPDSIKKEINSPWAPQSIINCVCGMHWRFVCADSKNFFVVTDNPAFFFEDFGMARANAEFTFPISHNMAIFGSWTPISLGKRICRNVLFVREANRRLISNTHRFIYSRSKEDWIRKVAAKPQPYLSQIKW